MKHKDIIFAILIIIMLIGIDQITKVIAFNNLNSNESYRCLPGLFRVELVRNTGAAFGIMSGKMWFFNIITIVSLVIFAYLMKDISFNKAPIYTICLAFIVSGTIGNFIDRVILGYVRDFLTFDFMNFAVFNFADICLTVGVIMLLIDYLFGKTGELWKSVS